MSFSIDARGSLKIGLSYSDTEALVKSAFAAWPNADCAGGFPSIAVMDFGPTSCSRVEFNREGPNANAVIFQDLEWPHDVNQIGLTTVTFNTENGKILGADIEINSYGFTLTPLQARFAVTHEAGHFFGLDHSLDENAIMFRMYDMRGEEPMLTPDDIEGICAIYPGDRPQPVCHPEPQRGYAADCGGNVEGGCALNRRVTRPGAMAALLLAVLAAGVTRRRARFRA